MPTKRSKSNPDSRKQVCKRLSNITDKVGELYDSAYPIAHKLPDGFMDRFKTVKDSLEHLSNELFV